MQAKTVRDLGALVRSSRRAQGMTQAGLAARLGVSREWVVRLESGHPRLEAQKVLDAVDVLGLALNVEERALPSPVLQSSAAPGTPKRKAPAKKAPAKKAPAKKAPAKKAPAKKAPAKKAPAKWVAAKSSMAARQAPKKAPAKKVASSTTLAAARVRDPFDALFSQRRR